MKDKDDDHRQGIRSFAPIFLSFIYYGCGLAVVYRYHHLGIYIVRISILFNNEYYLSFLVRLVGFVTVPILMCRSIFKYYFYHKTSIK
jgi:hypothetical protein